MSRIGKMPIPVPPGVTIQLAGSTVTAKGPKGQLTRSFPELISFSIDGTMVNVIRADETKRALNAHGIQEVMYEAYTAGEKDYLALVTKIKAQNIDVIYVGGYHTEAGLIVRQMREQGMSTRLVSGDALVTNEYWSITGQAGQGTLMTFSPDPRKNPTAAGLVKRFRSAGYEPEGYTLYTYGAIQTWVQAVEKAASTDTGKVIKVLRSSKFDTVLGRIGFDAKGDVTAPGYVFYEWNQGKYDYYR